MSLEQLGEGCVIDLEDEEQMAQLGRLDADEQNLDEEAQKMLNSWSREKLMEEIGESKDKWKQTVDADDDYYDGETDFQDLKKDMVDIDGKGQVFMRMLESHPDNKQIKQYQTVLFERIGYLEDEPVPFESSIHDGKPCKINLMEGPIIPGMLLALLNMRERERANVLIHPAKAYGPSGALPLIPPDAYLFYNLKVYKVYEESELSSVVNCENIETGLRIPFEEKLALMEEHREVANQYFRDGLFREATVRYKVAIKILEDEVPDEVKSELPDIRRNLGLLYQNIAITFNKREQFQSASNAARRALLSDPKNLKAYYTLIKARISLGDNLGASKYLDAVKKVAPNDSSFNSLRLELSTKVTDERQRRTEIMQKMSKAFH